MRTDLELANFVINIPYSLSSADEIAIEKTSHGHPVKEDWKEGKLEDFKHRVRKFYAKAQNYKCAYCRMDVSLSTSYFEIEHIVPKSIHPEWMYEPLNLCVVCSICNSVKNDKEVLLEPKNTELPTKSADYLIVHPHMDNYFDHIDIVDGLVYKGLTPKGVKTIEICKLTRTELLAERAKLFIKLEQAENSYSRLLVTYTINNEWIFDMDELLGRVRETVQMLQ